MKIKICFILALLAYSYTVTNAQTVQKDDKILNLGLGLGSPLYSDSYYRTTVPPISASLEYIMQDGLFDGKAAFGIGGYLGFSVNHDVNDVSYTNLFLGPRGYLHYGFVEKLDTYAGLMLGYWINTHSAYNGNEPPDSHGGFIASLFIGGRYELTDKYAGMLEIGYGISYLNIGVAIRL